MENNKCGLENLKDYLKRIENAQIIKEEVNEEEFKVDFDSERHISENDFERIEKIFEEENNYVKLIRVSGVYRDNDSSKEMIQEIVGKSFSSIEEKDKYIEEVEKNKLRDHRIIGRDLDLFCFSDYVGAGLPLYTPRGCIIKDELQKEVEKICRRYGFQKVSCPSLADISLFETSGHAAKFNDELFRVNSPKGHEFVLKPVQCPHHTQVYASKIRSYKDLPIRYMESDKQYRAELQGAVGNSLSRVYAISIEDGHSFCRVDQVKDEVIGMCNIIKDFYNRFGLYDSCWVSLSLRDKDDHSKYIGSEEDWEYCESMLEEVSNELGLNAKKCYGEAALYGPKLDFMFKDALGREVQIPTVQVDFSTPKRFNLSYVDENGDKQVPVMVHRAILGSYERFIALILEQFNGVLPIWLSPVQVNIIPVNIKYHDEYCRKVKELLLDNDIRVEYDDSEERMANKLRNSIDMKNPISIIIGDNERDNNLVSVRLLGSEENISMKLDEFIDYIRIEVKKR